MNLGNTLLPRFVKFVSWTSFARMVLRYGGDCVTHSNSFRSGQIEGNMNSLKGITAPDPFQHSAQPQ